jgi:hypothetical protein
MEKLEFLLIFLEARKSEAWPRQYSSFHSNGTEIVVPVKLDKAETRLHPRLGSLSENYL